MKKSHSYQSLSDFSDETMTYNHIRCHNINQNMFSPETHDVFEMILLKEGDINYITEDKGYHVKPNTLILTRPGDRHYLQFNDKIIYDRFDVLFDSKTLFKGLYEMLPHDLHVIHFDDNDRVLRIFESMECYCMHFEGNMLKNILLHLVEEIVYNIVVSNDLYNVESAELVMKNDMLTKAIEYINENLEHDFTLDELCQALYITKGYLYKLFHQHLYISPKKYIISKRLAKAQSLIRQNKKPTEIYSECGFTDYSSFYRNYKIFYGYAPSDELNIKRIREIQS